MSIIDPEGKLFGKINIIDLAIVLVLFFSLAVAVYLLLGHSLSGNTLQEAEVKIQPYRSWIFDAVKVGDVEVDGGGKVVGEVIAKDFENNLVVAKLNLYPLKEGLMYQGKNVKVGYNMRLNTQEVFVDGIIKDLRLKKKGEPAPSNPNLMAEPVQVIAKVQLKSPSEAIMKSIAPGDREIESDGEKSTTVAEILFKDPDVEVITAKLATLKLARGFSFRDQKLKIGSRIYIATEKAFIEGSVIDFLEVSGADTVAALAGWRQQPVQIVAKIRPPQSQGWLLDSLVVGDKETALTDGHPVALAEVLKKEPERGYLIARLHAQRSEDELTFKGETIKIGTDVHISTNTVAIEGAIIDFREEIQGKNGDYFSDSVREPVQVIVQLTTPLRQPWLLVSVSVGDKETILRDGQQVTLAEILDKAPEAGNCVARLHAEKGENGLEFKGAPLKIGAAIHIDTPKVLLHATVTDLYEGDLNGYIAHTLEQEATTVTRLIGLRLEGKEPWFVSSLRKGDVGSGKRMDKLITVAEIVKIETTPSQVLVVDNGVPTWVDHPRNVDITLWVRVKGKRVHEEFYFEGQPVKIGRPVEMETENTEIEGIVIDAGTDTASIPPQSAF